MPRESSLRVSTPAARLRPPVVDRIARLLGSWTDPVAGTDVRRRQLLAALAADVAAHAGHWAWGRGHPDRGVVIPAAVLPFGQTPDEFGRFVELASSEVMDRHLREPVAAILGPKAPCHETTLRSDLYPVWQNHPMRVALLPARMDEWLHSVHYAQDDTWANLFLARRPGEPPFSADDKQVTHAVLKHAWFFHAPDADDTPGPTELSKLTRRQQMVAVLLLDGRSRKQISGQLRISEYTVNDHVGAVFEAFDVHTTGELSAKFLRRRGPSK